MLSILLFTLIPTTAALLGGTVGSFVTPRKNILAALQHFVAGIVIAAVSTELLPQILGDGHPVIIAISFIVGVIFMLFVEKWAHALMHKSQGGLVAGASIDLFVDGFLIGLSFLAGIKSGLLIAISLSFCAFFLSLTVLATLKQARLRSLILLALMLPLGALLGGGIAPFLFEEAIAFGVAALLYLGIEELLGEAHKKEDNVWISATFFLGFFLVFIFNLGSIS